MLIGIAGHISAGKDTVAEFLVATEGFVRLAFADPLKEEVYTRLRGTMRAYVKVAYPNVGKKSLTEIDAFIRSLFWGKKDEFSRNILQEYGTEVRRTDDPEYWIKAFASGLWDYQVNDTPVVTPDTRFVNEAQCIRKLGGYLIRVDRPGFEGDAHRSENDLADWTDYDLIVSNSGGKLEVYAQVSEWFRSLAVSA